MNEKEKEKWVKLNNEFGRLTDLLLKCQESIQNIVFKDKYDKRGRMEWWEIEIDHLKTLIETGKATKEQQHLFTTITDAALGEYDRAEESIKGIVKENFPDAVDKVLDEYGEKNKEGQTPKPKDIYTVDYLKIIKRQIQNV